MDDEFTKLVERCAKNLENQVIYNASADHALVLFQKLLEVSERMGEAVKIFSGRFEAGIYDKLIPVINRVLIKNSVRLISECPATELAGNIFVDTVRNNINGTVKSLPPHNNKFPHFILIGNLRYRFETDNGTKSATANFNDPLTGSLIDKQFNSLWASAT